MSIFAHLDVLADHANTNPRFLDEFGRPVLPQKQESKIPNKWMQVQLYVRGGLAGGTVFSRRHS
jgi:hypothetical protein